MKCAEGLIYDSNLRSCAIPGDRWECKTGSEEIDENSPDDEINVYGVKNLEVTDDDQADNEFLEVIDGNWNLSEEDTNDNDLEASGEGEITNYVTPSTPTVAMITTQLQRLSQLIQHVKDKNDRTDDDEEMTPEDLNSFLATQKIQSDSNEYQRTNFQSSDKTPMPSSGRINPQILSEVLNTQTQLNSGNTQLTTLAMDETTPKVYPKRVDDDPTTEIKMKSGSSSDGMGSHQIVVNRPEGSVLFNVPSPHENNYNRSPYLSEDILKTILEISRQMVKQNYQKENPPPAYSPPAPQPFYYAVPVPIQSPQSNAQNYFGQGNHNYQKNLTEFSPVRKKKPKPSKIEIVSTKNRPKLTEKVDTSLTGYYDNYGFYHAGQHQTSQQSYSDNPQSLQYPQSGYQNVYKNPQSNYPQNPSYYYHNYPSYPNSYQNSYQLPSQPPYSPYQFPSKAQKYSDPMSYNQQYNFDSGAYYGNRPIVSDSSAPSYVEQPIRQKPFRKESYAPSYENDDDEEVEEEQPYDDAPVEPPKEQLICTPVVQRQANRTDCFRYYVCNSKTKEVLAYTCPIFTAFNDQTKFCDSQSYDACRKMKDQEKNQQKIYKAANIALEKVKKESQKVERIASLMRKKHFPRRNPYQPLKQFYEPDDSINEQENPAYEAEEEEEQDQSYYPTSYMQEQNIRKPMLFRQKLATESPVPVFKPKPPRKTSTKKKKKKVKCSDAGNIVDPDSSSSYWHCFKGTDGRMKRINRKCTSNFIFCPTTRFCSPENRCQT